MAVEGVDYSYDPPSVAALVAAGKKFVCRYGGPGSSAKHLTPTESTALRAAGISIVANAQGTGSTGLLGGALVGADWARLADAHFRSCGMPADRPIYLSVDFDAQPSQWPAVDAALRAAADVLGPDRVGVYGGYNTIEHCATTSTASWFWQTYAWSGGRWHPRAHLHQYLNGQPLADGLVDLDRAVVGDYGQWGGPMPWILAPNLAKLRINIKSRPQYGSMVIYTIGDDLHRLRTSSHNPDDTVGSLSEYSDADTIAEVRALDLMVGSISMANMNALVEALRKSGGRLSYIIFNGSIYRQRNGFAREVFTGADQHTDHIHLSGDPDDDENSADWPAVLALGSAGGGNDLYCNYGDKDSPNVRLLQTQLRRLGQNVTVDGDYGDGTKAALAAVVGSGASGVAHTWFTLDQILTKLAKQQATPGPKGDKGDPGEPGEPGAPGAGLAAGAQFTLDATVTQVS